MRTLQRRPAARLLRAAIVSGLVTLAAWRFGIAILLLFVVVTALAFLALTLAPDVIAPRRRRPWRWWERGSPEEGPFWPGTRIPHRRRPPQ